MTKPKINLSAIGRKMVYAMRGLYISFKEERSLVIECIMAIIAIVIGLVLQISPTSWAILVIMIGIVISSELLNTTIENVVDMVSFKFNFNAKKIKDISAASTFVLAIVSIIVGLLIFIPRIVQFAQNGYGFGGWQ